MIRIKGFILNENDIKVIENDEDLLTIVFKDGTYRETQGTFDDIEWNYGNPELEELKLDYSAVVTSYKKLEEENKKLKSAMQDTYDSANDTCGELQQRIDKAIKYINSNSYFFTANIQFKLLEILNAEEK